jgi:hypothetical protein
LALLCELRLRGSPSLLLLKGKITVNWQWIHGHAIRRKRWDQFEWAEILNEAADDLATNARNHPMQLDDGHLPEQEISIIGARGRMSGHVAHEI